MRKQPTVAADYGGRGQVLSTVDDDRHLLITSIARLCALDDGRVAASRGPSALADTCNTISACDGQTENPVALAMSRCYE